MRVSIHPISLGFDHCYVIQGEGVIMVDGGAPKQAKSFTKAIERIPIDPEDIQLIVITHGHWDHIGSARDIKEMTGAKIAMHHLEEDWLEKSSELPLPAPPGVTAWGRILIRMLTLFAPSVHIPPTGVDIVLGDEGLSLAEFGIPGRVLHTPGHSPGSVTVLLETGDAFVGDLAMNQFPLRFSPGLPIFAQDGQKVRESWRLLLDEGAETVYPGHGKPFPADIIRKAIS